MKADLRCPTDAKVFEELLTGLGMEGTLEHQGHRVAWKYTDRWMIEVQINNVQQDAVRLQLADTAMSSSLLTIVGVQQAEQRVQQVADDGP